MNVDVAKSAAVASKGLKGVVAADSAICFIDGSVGKLIYRGYDIHELAEQSSYEEVSYLLFKGELPSKKELEEFKTLLAQHRDVPQPVIDSLRRLPKDVLPMTALRTAVSLAGVYDPLAEDASVAANWEKSIRLVAQVTSLVAIINRLHQGLEPVAARKDLSHAGNFMYMLNGKEPTADETRAMDLILILHAEHGFNASTFAARVIAATLSDLYSVITGAIGALKGPLHGGANTEVLKTLMEVGDVKNVEQWVQEKRARKEVFMGFGHAVYQVEDPRARHLKELSKRLSVQSGEPKWYDISEEIEKRVKAAINKNVNVDFFSASLQHYMKIPGDLFTCVFAASRIAGWCAHVLEQWQDNKIIRPSSNYTGAPERAYVAVEKR
ncbi:MAG: citrate synthase [Planctomycetales bacterium]